MDIVLSYNYLQRSLGYISWGNIFILVSKAKVVIDDRLVNMRAKKEMIATAFINSTYIKPNKDALE